MDKFPYFKCSVPIISEKDIHGVAQIISDKLFKGFLLEVWKIIFTKKCPQYILMGPFWD